MRGSTACPLFVQYDYLGVRLNSGSKFTPTALCFKLDSWEGMLDYYRWYDNDNVARIWVCGDGGDDSDTLPRCFGKVRQGEVKYVCGKVNIYGWLPAATVTAETRSRLSCEAAWLTRSTDELLINGFSQLMPSTLVYGRIWGILYISIC